MTSILTNTGAMAALQTLKATNSSLGKAQSEITTGLKIAGAKDNASTWAIAQTMRSDVASFNQVSDSLNASIAAVGTGVAAAEQISGLLTQMKAKVTASMAAGADTTTIQADIDALTAQMQSIVDAASINGLNFVGSTGSTDVLSSLTRDSTGAQSAAFIGVAGFDLSTGTAGTARGAFEGSTFTAAAGGDLLAFSVDAGAAAAETVTLDATDFVAGDKISISVGNKATTYTVTAEDLAATTASDVIAVKLKAAVDAMGIAGFSLDYNSAAAGDLIVNNDGTGAADRNVAFSLTPANAGGLSSLNNIAVGTAADRTAALAAVSTAADSVNAAAASLGSAQGRLEAQAGFISKLTDNFKTSIGAMVDADMEEASARLTALQTQQQLGIQSLSIANQTPQTILSLFR
ncbi:flagellin [Amaricoccus macauensis]|uniref:Flagellin n=1 Tax=Amaricoccus macauensis TaxID=57001 RepID=A0A840SKP9_9RHOB|nr:flagellin [Amaricoccus macauensis]MBB5221215.1 flagellin [Amaricoccus macauensis]